MATITVHNGDTAIIYRDDVAYVELGGFVDARHGGVVHIALGGRAIVSIPFSTVVIDKNHQLLWIVELPEVVGICARSGRSGKKSVFGHIHPAEILVVLRDEIRPAGIA